MTWVLTLEMDEAHGHDLVYISPFSTKEEAHNFVGKLHALGVTSIDRFRIDSPLDPEELLSGMLEGLGEEIDSDWEEMEGEGR